MSEYIGSRISLISKSDIRYVGTLHEINSESSTVALENVKSFGTEGRKGNPDEEVAPSDSTYEYIVFRGSDVKDLRIEEMSKENAQPPQVPNDPAILGSGARPPPQTQNYPQPQTQPAPLPPGQNQPGRFQPQPPYPPHFNQYPNQQFRGPPNGPYPGYGPPPGGYPNMPYGGPPGWGPPPGQFPPQHGPFSPQHHQQVPFGAPGLQMPPRPGQQQSSPQPPAPKQVGQTNSHAEPPAELSQGTTPTPPDHNKQPPPPPVESKPDLATAAAPPVPMKQAVPKPKANTTVPPSKVALPLANSAVRAPIKPTAGFSSTSGIEPQPAAKPAGDAASQAALQYQNATKAATAAVAAAMAKLPSNLTAANQVRANQVTSNAAVDNLTQKVNEMRTDDKARHGRGGVSERGHRGGRGSGGRERGGARGGPRGLEVPKTDFDFEKANAEFKKEDLVKEAIASGEPAAAEDAKNTNSMRALADGANGDAAADIEDVVIPPAPLPLYNKDSFFDNLSSEASDRQDATAGGEGGRGGRGGQFRREERSRNFETFGMGSVDGGFGRGGYRGRGRGRGQRGSGRGPRGYGQGRGRGGYNTGVEA